MYSHRQTRIALSQLRNRSPANVLRTDTDTQTNTQTDRHTDRRHWTYYYANSRAVKRRSRVHTVMQAARRHQRSRDGHLSSLAVSLSECLLVTDAIISDEWKIIGLCAELSWKRYNPVIERLLCRSRTEVRSRDPLNKTSNIENGAK